MTAASTYAAHMAAVENMERTKDEARRKWQLDATVHLSAHFRAVDIEAAEGGDNQVCHLLDAAGGIAAWINHTPADHMPIKRERWKAFAAAIEADQRKAKRKASY